MTTDYWAVDEDGYLDRRPYTLSGTFTPSGSYAQGEAVGALIELDIGAAVGVNMANKQIMVHLIHSLVRSDTPPTNVAFIPVLFNDNITTSTWTDADPTSLTAADLTKPMPWLSVSTAGGAAVIPNALCCNSQWQAEGGLLVRCNADGKLWLGFASASTMTLGANPGVSWRIQFRAGA